MNTLLDTPSHTLPRAGIVVPANLRMADELPVNTRLVLAHRPSARNIADCFRRERATLTPLQPGELLLRTHLVSVDICAHARMQADAPADDRLEPGQVMPCATVSRVERSRHPAFREGDHVLAHSGWQTHEIVDARSIKRKLYPKVAPLGSALGVYGLYGYIAWLAVREVCRPQPGQTAVVAAASGPIGATICQLLQDRGARVVAVTSGAVKCAHVRDNFAPSAVLDIEDAGFAAALAAACPDGIDIFVENVDGRCLDAALPLINEGARLPLCGAIGSQWRENGGDRLPAFLNAMLERRLEVRSFTDRALASLHARHLADPDFVSEMGALLRAGRLRWMEETMHGLDTLPHALARLVRGENLGKLLVRLD
ncbi:MAG: NADP-dependent oxidoreductase [Pseudoxanthomonas sp.]